jgi:hypothetical protein
MDFYVTVSSGPTPDYPGNQTAWCEYFLEKPIEMVGQYEVALVQSVFQNVFNGSLATISILPNDAGMEMHSFEMFAKDGEEVETIVRHLNKKMATAFQRPYSNFIRLNNETLEFEFDLPKDWQYFVLNVDPSHLEETQTKKFFKFKNKKFYHNRHYWVFSSLVDDQITGNTRHPLLSNLCLTEVNSNTVAHVPNSPRYIKVKDNKIESFNLEYSSSLYSQNEITGNIISTLHFRKLNGF